MEISLPTIDLRGYQRPAWDAFLDGARRIMPIWPRRGGKDAVAAQMANFELHRRKGNGWLLFPEKAQAKKAWWTAINGAGERVRDKAFPPELVESYNETEMFIQLKCGSTFQIGGSDRYDALVGSNPVVVVFSEYSTANPRSYDYVRPILAENGGLAIFPTTPRGRNHCFDLFNHMSADHGSFTELLTVEQTGHMSADALELERREMSEDLFLQEYHCSWNFGQEGAIYMRYLNRAHVEGRVCPVPYDRSKPVFVSFDLGKGDSTAIWYMQIDNGGYLNFLEYEEYRGLEVRDYVKLLREKDYVYHNELFLPHDASHDRLGMIANISNQFRQLGFDNRVLPQPKSLAAEIEQCRVAMGRARFDLEKTEKGRAALGGYVYEYDDKREVFKLVPLHNWASDGADSFRYMIQAHNLGYTDTGSWGKALDYSELNRAVI